MTRKGTFSSLSVFATLLLVATLAIPTTSAFAEDSPKASPEPVQASALTEDMTEEDAQGTLGNASSGAAQRDCEVKTLLHQNLHVTPNGEEVSYDDKGDIHSTYTDIMVGKHSYLEWLNLWFTRALLNVENDTAALPAFTVQSNVDGSFFETDRWNEDDSVALRPAEGGETTIRADAPHTEAENKGSGLLANRPSESNLKAGEGAALWSLSASEQVTIAVRIGVHVRAKVSDVNEGDIMMSAVLQDVASEPFNGRKDPENGRFHLDGRSRTAAGTGSYRSGAWRTKAQQLAAHPLRAKGMSHRHLISETEGILPTVPREDAAATSTAELWGVSPQFRSCALT